MRLIVLVFGFLGVLMTAITGVMFLFMDGFLTILKESNVQLPEFLFTSPLETPPTDTGVFLFIAAVYGLIGTILAFWRCGWQGGLLMLVPVLCAALMHPSSLVFTGLLAFTAFLSFFVSPLPLNPPADDTDDADEDEEDEEEAKPKRPATPAPKKAPDRDAEDEEEEEMEVEEVEAPKAKGKSKPKVGIEDDED